MNNEKIIIIGPVYPYKGGIAHYTSLLYQEEKKKYDTDLISYKMQYPRLLLKREQKDYANDLFKIEEAQFLINTANPFNIISIANIIKKKKPKAIIIQWWHPYFAPCYIILTKILKKRTNIIFVCHNVFPHERFPMDRFLTKMTLKNGNGFIVHSENDKKDLYSIKEDANVRKNPHPTYNMFAMSNLTRSESRNIICEKDRFDIETDTKLLLFFGFVREYKGLKNLLKAMPLIVEKIEDCKLMIVGSFGDDKNDYIHMIEELNLSNYIFIRDEYTPDNEVEKYFVASDIVVLPYEDATQSGVVQTAFGLNRPCLVTNVGGLPEVVTDGKTGYVVEAHNPAAISEAVVDFYTNNRNEYMIDCINSEKDRFSWKHMSETIDLLINN